jgi:hypothetical protein
MIEREHPPITWEGVEGVEGVGVGVVDPSSGRT